MLMVEYKVQILLRHEMLCGSVVKGYQMKRCSIEREHHHIV
jgi:hypothetical protein